MSIEGSKKISWKTRWLDSRIENALKTKLLSENAQRNLKERVDKFFRNTGSESFRLEFSGPFKMTKVVVEWKNGEIHH